MILEFGEYLPDKPALGNPGCLEANNCYAAESSYLPLKAKSAYSSALSERPLGTFRGKQSNATAYMFAGTASKINRLLTDQTWDDVSKVGGYSAIDRWEFTQFGDRVIAANIDTPLQDYVMGTDTDFGDLIATLQAETIASSDEFVMVGNTYDTTDGDVPHRVRWCAIGDPTDWTVSATTQSDYQDLNSEYGAVKRVIFTDGAFYVFQERAITRMQYVGSPIVFDVDTFETNRGAKYPDSVISVGSRLFYLSEDGFQMLRHSESLPIGEDKVNNTFLADLDTSYADRIRIAADPSNHLIMWAYPSTSGAGLLDKQLLYNWKVHRWTTADYELTHLGQALSLGYTLEDLDNITTDLDALGASLDSAVWQGGNLSLLLVDSLYKLASLDGDDLAATFTTAEFQPVKNQESHINDMRALTDATCTLTIGKRDSQKDSVSWSSAYSPESNGKYPIREKSRYFRARLITSSDFEHVQGVEVKKFKAAGSR